MATDINLVDRLPNIAVSGLNFVLAPFEDPVGLNRPLWRDYSRWQEIVDFDVAASNGVLGYAARSTISWGYQDTWFPRNWGEGGKRGLYRTSYHILYPKESVVAQADNWFRVHPELDIIPRVIDLELQHDASYKQIADATWELSNIVLSRDGVRPIIYSRYMLVNTWLASWTEEMLNAHYWWLAQYLWDRVREHPGEPTLPDRVHESNVILHQTADKKPGFSGEVASKSVDWDRWELGDATFMHAFISSTWGDEEPPTPPPSGECDCEQDIIDLREQVDTLASDLFNAQVTIGVNTNSISALDDRVSALEEAPPPTEPKMLVEVIDEKAVCFTYKDLNNVGKPIINIKYEPVVRWDTGERLLVYPKKIDADGTIDWYEVVPGDNGGNLVPVTANGLYVKTNEVVAV